MIEINKTNLTILLCYFIFSILSKFAGATAAEKDVEIYTNDWNPTPIKCTNGTFKGLISVFEVRNNYFIKIKIQIKIKLKN